MATEIPASCPPFYILVNETWMPFDRIDRDTSAVATTRPRSSITSLDGHRYEQRARMARRSWGWSLGWEDPTSVAILRAAIDSPTDVWLASSEALAGNMLANADCFGNIGNAVTDCGGIPLPEHTAGAVITARVRGGEATTMSCWVNSTSMALSITYPGGTTSLTPASASGQHSVTFTPSADGDIEVTMDAAGVTGLMLTEGTPSTQWVGGEAMPCKVVVDDLDDTLLGIYSGAYRHDYSVQIREVD